MAPRRYCITAAGLALGLVLLLLAAGLGLALASGRWARAVGPITSTTGTARMSRLPVQIQPPASVPANSLAIARTPTIVYLVAGGVQAERLVATLAAAGTLVVGA